MTLDLIAKARKLLDPEPHDKDQWEMLNRLLEGETEPDREAALHWVFTKHYGYIDVRIKAGTEFVQKTPEIGWPALEQLISSTDPDDRDTALSVLVKINDPRGYPLVKSMLNDPWDYLKLDAIDFLQTVYPEAVNVAIQALLESPDEGVRQAALKQLKKLHTPGASGESHAVIVG